MVFGLAACVVATPSRAPAPRTTHLLPQAPPTKPSMLSRESPACEEERTAIVAAMRASRDGRACGSAADCAVVTGPGHPSPDYRQVVHAADGSALDARAKAHLRTCGAFHRHDDIGVYSAVEARCVQARCTSV
jgi:hypothetical protein